MIKEGCVFCKETGKDANGQPCKCCQGQGFTFRLEDGDPIEVIEYHPKGGASVHWLTTFGSLPTILDGQGPDLIPRKFEIRPINPRITKERSWLEVLTGADNVEAPQGGDSP